MRDSRIDFTITHLKAHVDEGVTIEWQGRELASGPLNIELDQAANYGNNGELDYGKRRAHADFRVLLSFPDFANLLESLGADPSLTQPVHAAICSDGRILNNHSFKLSGRCELADHALLNSEETKAFVLPGT
jgi:hypothetical protein